MRSCNHCCSGKKISITYSECALVALGFQHAMRMRRIILSTVACHAVDYVLNVMAYMQKPDFVFRRNGRVHLNRQGASVQSTTGSRCVPISGSNAGYTMFRGSVKGTGYRLHSPVSPSLPLPRVTVCHHISTGLYHILPYYLINCAIFRKQKLLSIKCVLIFSANFQRKMSYSKKN